MKERDKEERERESEKKKGRESTQKRQTDRYISHRERYIDSDFEIKVVKRDHAWSKA